MSRAHDVSLVHRSSLRSPNMAEAEELRRLTLAAKAKLSLESTQSDDLDENVLAGIDKPLGRKNLPY